MTVSMIILGSILGFIGGAFAFLFFGATFATALLIWALSGPVLAAIMMIPRVRQAANPATA